MALSFTGSRRVALVHADEALAVVSAAPGDSGSLEPARARAHSAGFALLGADRYLVRRFDLPATRADELGAMVRLHAEAAAPAVFGAFEVSYRVLPSDGLSDRVNVEAYLAKRSDVVEAIAAGESVSVRVRSVVPSAALWASALASSSAWAPKTHGSVFIASAGLHRFELVITGGDGTPAVHTLEARDKGELQQETTSILRATGRGPASADEPTWIGPPPAWLDGEAEPVTGGDSAGLLTLAAIGLAPSGVPSNVALVPASVARRAVLRRRIVRGIAAAGMLVGAVASTVIGFEIGASRYHDETARLGNLVSQIRVESEASEHRLSQVDAVASARSTQQDFSGVLDGLFRASPQRGLSFSLIEGDSSGQVVLRGHADELSLPFELPERLERDRAFADVMLTDTGRSVRGGSSVSEFAAEARLVREGSR